MGNKKREVIDAYNPRTGKIDYHLENFKASELENIVKQLREKQSAWEKLGVDGRIEVLFKWKEVLEEHRDELLESVTQDTGRRRESVREVVNVSKWIERWSEIAKEQFAAEEIPSSIPNVSISSGYSAYPVVGVISPWNFPLSLSLMDAIPALLAGCSVVIKPSEVTSRFVEPVMETIQQVPELANIFTYATGAGETGAALVEYVDMVCFTGSVNTGKKVAVRAAERFIPAFLELGGKDPAIVTETADLERAASALLVGSVLGAGQQCYSIERIFVAESVHDEFARLLSEKAKRLNFAYPTPESGEIGPIIHAPQAEIIEDHLQDALDKGAKIQCGGKIENLEGGLYCQPTVLTNVKPNMKIFEQETFGPVMPIISYATIQEAIEMANESEYGLSGAVFAGTKEEATEIALAIDVGGININDTGLSPFFIGDQGSVEKTSFKSSGLGGSRIGSASIKRFVRKKALFINESTEKSPWWYEEN